MPQRREFVDFSNENSCEIQTLAPGVTVKPFYLHSTCLAILEMQPGSMLPEHKHIHEQVLFVSQGELQVTIDSISKNAHKGDVLGIKSNTLHSYQASNQPVRIIVASSPLLRDYVFTEE